MRSIDQEYPVKPVWIDPSWLLWETTVSGWSSLSRDSASRAYEIHQHAYDKLANNPDEFDRVDAIMTLRRAIAQRIKILKNDYKLRKLPIRSKPKDDLELLSYFELIRPLMLRRLIEIRNIVQHQDAEPPSLDECLMYADLVWYFLRSTDAFARIQIETINFDPPEVDEGSDQFYPTVELQFDVDDFSRDPKILTWLNVHSITYEPNGNWLAIDTDTISGFKDDEESRAIRGKHARR